MKLWKMLFLAGLVSSAALYAADDVVMFNGGVGLEERENVPANGTRLEFTGQGGHYLTGVKVVVSDAQGKAVVNMEQVGPLLVLALPEGNYRVRAERRDGEAQGAAFTATSAQQRVILQFKGE